MLAQRVCRRDPLRARQQAATADSAGRRVPAPLPAPPAATLLHAHPQLRLPRQPETRFAAATLLPAACRFSQHLGSNHIACRGSSSLVHPLELSRLRRLHAHRGTALRSSTSPTFSTPRSLMCRMSLQLQPRSLHLLRHAHPRCVLSSLWHQQNQLNHHPQLLQDHLFLPSPRSRPTHTVRNTSPAIQTTRRNPIENT